MSTMSYGHVPCASALPAAFHKSSRSNNGGNCVEVASALVDAAWHTSTRSGSGNQCVEVADNLAATRGYVAVRDSKDPHGPALTVAPDAWAAFTAHLPTGAAGRP